MSRLKELLQKKIERVKLAEMNGDWNTRTIETETEFLLEIKKLIVAYETLSLETLSIEPASVAPEIQLRDDIIRGLLIEILGLKVAGEPVFMLDFNIQNLIEYRKLNINGCKALADFAITDYCYFHLKTAPKKEQEHLFRILNSITNEKQNNR